MIAPAGALEIHEESIASARHLQRRWAQARPRHDRIGLLLGKSQVVERTGCRRFCAHGKSVDDRTAAAATTPTTMTLANAI